MPLSFIPPIEINGVKGVKLEKQDVKDEVGKWEHGVVGYIMGFNPAINQMKM